MYTVACIDVETTGLNPRRGHRVIEVGVVMFQDGQLAGEFHSLVATTRRISGEVSRIHGITNEMLQNQPEPEEVFPALQDIIGSNTLVAHNAPFDVAFLRHEFSRLGMALQNPVMCTLELSRRRYPQLPNHKLQTVARHLFGDPPTGHRNHRALDDARLTAKIWMAMGRR